MDGLQQNITLTNEQRERLTGAREAVRSKLRADFRTLTEAAISEKIVLLRKSFQTRERAEALRLRPKFREQGSFSYHTVNYPAHVPPQQVDVDDGVYLPTSFVNEQDPDVAAEAYFAAVENSLRPLCVARGWKLLENGPSSCVRISLGRDAHLDLPLYAIPDEQFADEETLLKAARLRGIFDADDGIALLTEGQYRSLPADHIMLAHRDGSWELSDPRKMEDWFNLEKQKYGDVLRLTCRYLKAWRDYQWPKPKTGPSSICLMASVVRAFDDEAPPSDTDRHDLALKMTAARLPVIFAGAIENPAVKGAAHLDADWTDDKRQEFITSASDLHDRIAKALDALSADAALSWMNQLFGPRIPTDVTLVRTEEEARILSVPPTVVRAPTVARSVSG